MRLRSVLRHTSDFAQRLIHPGKRRRHRVAIRRSIYLFIIVVAIFSYVTNPFVKFSIVVDPYTQILFENDEFILEGDQSLIVQEDAFFRRLALLKSGWHIFSSKFSGGQKAKRSSVDEIIRQIHLDRFDPQQPFLISGDHFSVLYPRSLGIFYNSILDGRTALNETDWKNRQLIYLKTLAYALQAFEHSSSLSTTIVPVGPRSIALLNFYAPPSDTLYSLFYALLVLQDENAIASRYPFEKQSMSLQTSSSAKKLLELHNDSLTRHYENFMNQLYDEQLGLVRTDQSFSGTKDIVFRQGAFYHNIMVWATTRQAQQLGLIEKDERWLNDYKQRIIDTYWVEEEGLFLEDLGPESLENNHYSSDWLIAYQTGFLDPNNPNDLPYLEKSVEYIRRNAIDQPFGLQYHPDPRRDQAVWIVKIFAPDYASTAIWSHWGMEYIKLLVNLAQVTGDPLYLEQADGQLSSYAYNIKRYRGYPEVYNQQGDFFRQTFYKSIRQTGWIVNYEQARAMFEWTNNQEGLRRQSSPTPR